jgi:hypothetical protein
MDKMDEAFRYAHGMGSGDHICHDSDLFVAFEKGWNSSIAALAARATPAQPVPHSDDLAVDRFAAAMKAKMAASRAKGRSGWDDERQCPMAKLSNMLIAHARKGDPVDVANFAMMLQQREQMEIEHHPCHAGIATVSLRSAMDELLGTVDGENMDWKQQATLLALEKIARPSPASDVGAPSPSSVGDAIRAMPLPEPLEIYWPQLNSNALGCGVEDRNIRDRYEAAEYGWQDGVDKAAERVPEDIYTADQVRELLSEAAAIAEQVQGQLVPDGWALVPCKMTDEQAREVVYNINRKYKGNPMSDYLARTVWEWAIYAKPAAPSIAQDGQKSEADRG